MVFIQVLLFQLARELAISWFDKYFSLNFIGFWPFRYSFVDAKLSIRNWQHPLKPIIYVLFPLSSIARPTQRNKPCLTDNINLFIYKLIHLTPNRHSKFYWNHLHLSIPPLVAIHHIQKHYTHSWTNSRLL